MAEQLCDDVRRLILEKATAASTIRIGIYTLVYRTSDRPRRAQAIKYLVAHCERGMLDPPGHVQTTIYTWGETNNVDRIEDLGKPATMSLFTRNVDSLMVLLGQACQHTNTRYEMFLAQGNTVFPLAMIADANSLDQSASMTERGMLLLRMYADSFPSKPVRDAYRDLEHPPSDEEDDPDDTMEYYRAHESAYQRTREILLHMLCNA